MLHKFHIAAFAALLLGCSGSVAAQEEAARPATGPVLLIGNKGEDTLSFVDLASGQELGRQPTGKAPHEIAISPDGKTAAVVAYGGRTIDLFDVASRTKLKTIDLAPNEGPAWHRLAQGRADRRDHRTQQVDRGGRSRGGEGRGVDPDRSGSDAHGRGDE